MSELNYRYFYFDPDFRRTPKTDRFCCVCQKDLAMGKGLQINIDNESFMNAIHPDDATIDNSLKAWIGSDCAKRIPSEFLDDRKNPIT